MGGDRHPVDAVMLARRAASFTRRSIKADSKQSGLRLAISMLDLTTLEGADSPELVRALCQRAIHPCPISLDKPVPPVAAVCVYPRLVPVVREALLGTGVLTASVATSFPSGQSPLDARLAETEAAIAAGADEIDMVISRGAFLSGRFDEVAAEVRAVQDLCGQTHLKVILETGELATPDNIRRCADLVIEAASRERDLADGALFVKTSTGKISPAATMPSVLLLLEAVRDHFRATGVRIGVKPAGGIRKSKAALHMLVMVRETLGQDWLTPKLFRIGASSLLDDLVRQLLWTSRGHYAAMHDVAVT
ncbi:MAG: deoxyribose-phosphate aldolase [Phycisphaerales bacterium]|jgi:deoxyribose-phosphate aldolase|nr:deoxyribose-phosphate aldolase [Phycisphaerales bacterium]MDP7087974.1 deoxyribose-phosphate aldolase [Phycisphaerales bacterium]MDP7190104.1 deoxyribose-phosphate aldolase [Phycisphaerales bacterium]MDP7518542.1 deoxyribose-phosphate aldolase [Phycisphaerales bacterium]HJN79268.1 deoxyribose-phosphate aldolase [Phycisphaerales bacterium]